MLGECAIEIVKYQNLIHSLLLSTRSNGISEVVVCKQFSKLQKLLRVTVHVKKSVLTFKSLIKDHSILIDWRETAEDMEEAKMDWLTKCDMHMTKEEKCDVQK